MSGNILFLGNKIFEIPPFFQTRPGDLGEKVHACSLRFSALKCSSSRHVDAKMHPSVGAKVTEISPLGRVAFINRSWLGWGEY